MSGFMATALQYGFFRLYFNNMNCANVGDATGLRGSSTAGTLGVSLHTASPGVGGTQTTNVWGDAAYIQQSVARSSAGWTVTSATPTTSQNAAQITWAASTSAGPATLAYVGVGSGTSLGNALGFAALVTTPSGGLIVNIGTAPYIAALGLTITID
jgi:hypothetical protein